MSTAPARCGGDDTRSRYLAGLQTCYIYAMCYAICMQCHHSMFFQMQFQLALTSIRNRQSGEADVPKRGGPSLYIENAVCCKIAEDVSRQSQDRMDKL